MNKRGISAVVATVLIILLVVSAVGIVWLGIIPMIADINIDKSAGLRLVSTEGHTLWDPESRLATVQIERAADGPDVYGIDIVFSFSGDSVTHFVDDVPGANGKKVYYVNLSEYSGELDSIKIVPIFWGGIAGDVASELKIEKIPKADIVEMIEEEEIVAEDFVVPSGSGGGGGGGSGGGSSGDDEPAAIAACQGCGGGVLNLCDKTECEVIVEGCFYSGLFTCDSCSVISCSNYNEGECNLDICNLDCAWNGSSCVEEQIVEDVCVVSNTSWQQNNFYPQIDIFEITYESTPLEDDIDGVIGFSEGLGFDYGDFSMLIRFNDSGYLDVRNGGAYSSDMLMPYIADTRYSFRLVGDIDTQTYDVYVTPEDLSEELIADDYAFRIFAGQIDNYGFILSSGGQEVCDVVGNMTDNSVCGDGLIEGVEVCDGVNLSLQTCVSQGFDSGSLSCLEDCSDYDTSSCVVADPVCGDDVCDSGENCGSCESDCGACGDSLIKPIARTDVVPYQRIDYGTDFKFGVVAFSKPGINRVEFDISGQGYSGGLKTSTEMTLNTRVASEEYDGVWEYWVFINSTEFSGNGEINVTPTVYDNDGNFRELVSTVLIVEGASADFDQYECFVDSSGSAGTVGDEGDPFPNVVEAIDACEVANGGSSSGNIIYLTEGVYEASDFFATVSGSEWLTFTKAEGANRNNVIVRNNGGGYTYENWLKFDDVTLRSECEGCRVIYGRDEGYFSWTNHCRRIGAGRRILNSNPVSASRQGDLGADLDGHYSTDDYTYDVNYAYQSVDLIRGAVVDKVANDVFGNFQFVVNARVTNLSNGAFYNQTTNIPNDPDASAAHSDVLQVYHETSDTIPVENRLAFNVFATDIHYQGIMRESTIQPARNNAFVNVFIEMRELPTDGTPWNGLGNDGQLNGGLIATGNDESHLLIWHSSFPYTSTSFYDDPVESSFYGNHFWMIARRSGDQTIIDDTMEWAYTHYNYADGITGDCAVIPTTHMFRGYDCPRSVNIAVGTNYTTGDGVVDISDPNAADFGYPVPGSVLIDRLPEVKVPCDVFGNARDAMPDVGAIEFV